MSETVTFNREHIYFLLQKHRMEFREFLRRYFGNDTAMEAEPLFAKACEIIFTRMQNGEQALIFDLRRAMERAGQEVGVEWLKIECQKQGLTTRVYRVTHREPNFA